jgi:hypothetical protein
MPAAASRGGAQGVGQGHDPSRGGWCCKNCRRMPGTIATPRGTLRNKNRSTLKADLEAILGIRVDLIPASDLKPGVREQVEPDLIAL